MSGDTTIERFLQKHFVQFAIAGCLMVGVLFILFTPSISLVKRISNFTVHIMLAYLMIGMFFFIFDQKRLVIVSLLGCGVLCLYLKAASNQNMRLALVNQEPNLRIALVDLSSAEDSYEQTIEHIKSVDADIISLQELTPNWVRILQDSLNETHPYSHLMVRIDPYGMGAFSKLPFSQVDTFYYKNVPNLLTSVNVNETVPVHLMNSISEAPVNDRAYAEIRSHFREIAIYSAQLEGHVVAAGNYHLPSWSPELQEFKFNARLNDSRRDGIPRSPEGLVSFIGVPVDHIFFSDQLECTEFRVIKNENGSHLGILGSYQQKSNQSLQ